MKYFLSGSGVKRALSIVLSGLVAIFFSCGRLNDNHQVSILTDDTLQTKLAKKEKIRLEKRRKIEGQNKSDSINLDKILREAIEIATQNKDLDRFEMKYVETMPDSSYQVDVSIKYGFYFTKESPHFVIRRTAPGTIYIDVFSKMQEVLQKVLSHEQWDMTYLNDTIRDINGDGRNDFVVNWYGSNGCCLKAFSNVYLLRPDKKSFSNSFQFINPTFSPGEKIIRGVCYGHPGDTEMYKYKWNGEAVDTLEYISYESNKGGKTGNIIVSNTRPLGSHFKILKLLKSVPNEYKKIQGYDWFTATW